MLFDENTISAALERSGGRCECTRSGCSGHYLSRCGAKVTTTTAQYHRKKENPLSGAESLSNCEVLCVNCAHQAELDVFTSGHAQLY